MSSDLGPLDSANAFAYSAVDPLEQYLALTILGDESAKDLSVHMALSHVLARLRGLQTKASSETIHDKLQDLIDRLFGSGSGSAKPASNCKVKVKVKVKDEPEPNTPAAIRQASDSKVKSKKETAPVPPATVFEADVNDTILLLLLGDGPFLIGKIGLGVLRQRLTDLTTVTNDEEIEEKLNSQMMRLLHLTSEQGLLKLWEV
jgi:hypothetical protein